jgi:hypothetical protein
MTTKPVEPCAQTKKVLETTLPTLKSESARKLWSEIFTDIDLTYHQAADDIKQIDESKPDAVELIARVIQRETRITRLMAGLAFLDVMSLGDGSEAAIQALAEATSRLDKEMSKHRPVLDILHDEFDKTAEARRLGKQVYK